MRHTGATRYTEKYLRLATAASFFCNAGLSARKHPLQGLCEGCGTPASGTADIPAGASFRMAAPKKQLRRKGHYPALEIRQCFS